jgi:putative ABC transport system permease protein
VNRTVIAASVRVGFETLRANPLRTLLSTLGIIMGVASLVSVLALGDGFEHFARTQIERTTDLQMMSVIPRTVQMIDGQQFPRSDYPVFTEADADSVRRLAGPGALVSMEASGQALVTVRGSSVQKAAQVTGVGADYIALHDQKIVRGRHFTPEELRAGGDGVVISESLARELVAPRQAATVVGSTIQLQGAPRKVIGVLESPADPRAPKFAVVPLSVIATVTVGSNSPRPAMLLARMGTVEQVKPARAAVEQWLTRRYGAWRDRVAVGSHSTRLEQAQTGIFLFKLLMGALTGISLLVGGIGIMNVLLASVIERTREIGIRKAAGAQQRHILLQFLSESVTISGVGSLIGVALGVGAAFAVTAIMRSLTKAPVYAGFSLSTFLTGVIASMLVGLVFGLYPAMRAARLSPIEAIHHE